jgi:phosphatidylserine decarboxylase
MRDATLSDWLKSLPLYPLPHHAVSRLMLALTRWRWRPFRSVFTRWFIARYGVDMSEALEPDLNTYAHFNAFFTRALKPGARPLPDDAGLLVSPADGAVSELGRIRDTEILQAKGRRFTLEELLGGDRELVQAFRGGDFATVYLSPRDYHRVHMPAAAGLRRMIHVPGRLFSVAPHTVRTIPRLFARNERVVCAFDTAHGPMALVLVGAICVASIETTWAGVVTPPRGRRIRHWDYSGESAPHFRRGDEMGRFNMGSTVIVLTGPGQAEWRENLKAGDRVRMGQPIGRYLETPADPA